MLSALSTKYRYYIDLSLAWKQLPLFVSTSNQNVCSSHDCSVRKRMQPAKVLVLDFFQAFSCSCWAGFMGLALPLPLPHNVPGVAPTRVAHPAIPKVLSGQVYFRHNLLKPSSATQATTEIRCPILRTCCAEKEVPQILHLSRFFFYFILSLLPPKDSVNSTCSSPHPAIAPPQ